MRKSKQTLKPIGQSDFSYWQALYLAFFSPRLYIDVVKRWHGFGMGYFLLLMLIISIPWSIYYAGKLTNYINDEIIYPFEQMPLLLIQNGEATIDKPMPYIVKSKSNKPAIGIDTTSDLNSFPQEYPTLFFFVTKNALLFRVPAQGIVAKQSHSLITGFQPIKNLSEYHFKKNDNEVFSGPEWVKTSGIESINNYAFLIVYPIVLGVLWGLYFITNFVLASIGRIISSVILKFPIRFVDSFRLTWVASTAPVALVNTVLYFGFNARGLGWYYFLLVSIYFSAAVLCVKRESQSMVRQ